MAGKKAKSKIIPTWDAIRLVLAAPSIETLTPAELRVLLAFVGHADFDTRTGRSYPSNELVAKEARCCVGTVLRCTKRLEALGLLVPISKTPGVVIVWRVVIPGLFPLDATAAVPGRPAAPAPLTSDVTRTETDNRDIVEPDRDRPQGRPERGAPPPENYSTGGKGGGWDALPRGLRFERDTLKAHLANAFKNGLVKESPSSEAALLAWTQVLLLARERATGSPGGYVRTVIEDYGGSVTAAAATLSADWEEKARRVLRQRHSDP